MKAQNLNRINKKAATFWFKQMKAQNLNRINKKAATLNVTA